MSELRRNGGPDDGDKTADAVSNTDSPARRPNLEIRSADQNPDWPVDRRKVTTTQRHFLNIEKESADSPIAGGPVTTLSADWKTGESADSRHAPPSRDKGRKKPDDSPYADPPPDFHRDNADLEARTIQRTGETRPEEANPAADTTKKRRRSILDKAYENHEDIMQEVHDATDMVGLFQRPPTHTSVGSVPAPPHLAAPIYGAHTAGDAAAALTAGALLLTGLGHKMHEKIEDRKARHGGNG